MINFHPRTNGLSSNSKFGLFLNLAGLKILKNLLSSWPFLKPTEVYVLNSKIFPFLKQSLAFFNLQASGNPGHDHDHLTIFLAISSFMISLVPP